MSRKKFTPYFTEAELNSEEWRDIPDFSSYQVSDLGRVRSLLYRNLYGSFPRIRILKTCFDSNRNPYLLITLHRFTVPRQKVTFRVHILVALAFLSPDPSRPQINHKDGVKTNNRVLNLERVTGSENHIHAQIFQLCAKGESVKTSKLTELEVLEIRAIYSSRQSRKYGAAQLAARFNVTPSTILRVVKKQTWTHI